MPVDKAKRRAEADAVGGPGGVSWALRQARDEKGLTQQQLADLVGLMQPAIQKWEGGRTPHLDRLAQLEEAMGYTRGHVLRLAGYVVDPTSAEEAIAADPGLTPDARAIVLDAYRSARRLSAERRASSRARKPTAASAATPKKSRK